jgi:biopolymer transport protein TolR
MAFARFDRNPGAQPMSDINMTPLIDVMLVLLVIFILAAPLLSSTIPLQLPQAGSAQAQPAPPTPPVAVTLDAQGQMYLNDQPITPTDLAQRLADAARQSPDAELQLRADAAVPYGRVVELIALAQQAGLQRIGFVAQPAEASAAPAAVAPASPRTPAPAPR